MSNPAPIASLCAAALLAGGAGTNFSLAKPIHGGTSSSTWRRAHVSLSRLADRAIGR